MARGIKKNAEIDGDIVRASDEDIARAAAEAKAEFAANKKAVQKTLKTIGAADVESNVAPVASVGDFMTRENPMDAATAKLFAKKPVSKKGWIKMTQEECMAYQEQGLLIGFDPKDGMGLLKEA